MIYIVNRIIENIVINGLQSRLAKVALIFFTQCFGLSYKNLK